MHTSNTLFSNLHAYRETMELGPDDIILGASPMAHLTGYGYLAMLPLILNSTTVLQDVWEPRRALQIVRDENVSFSMASSPFVADLCNAVEAGEHHCALQQVLLRRCADSAGAHRARPKGARDAPVLRLGHDRERRGHRHRAVARDGEVRCFRWPSAAGHGRWWTPTASACPPARAARCWYAAPPVHGGYLKRPQLNATSADGWFDTGDVATIDAEGYIRITGRSKDVVIRGGENIPVVEIENLLYQHPAIAVVAVVGYPDKRLGERVCAFVSLKPGASGEPTAYRAPAAHQAVFPRAPRNRRRPSAHAERQAAEVQARSVASFRGRGLNARVDLPCGPDCDAGPCLHVFSAVRNSHSKAKHERTRCRRNHRPGWPCPHQPPGSVQRAQRRRDERPRRGARPFRGRPSDPLRGPHRIGQGLRGRRRHHGHPPLDYMDAYKGNLITRNWERLKSFRKPVIAAVSGWRWAAAASWR
jgi:hypothetical protein